MEKQELIEDFELFLNQTGNWNIFKAWLDDRGATLEDYGFGVDSNED